MFIGELLVVAVVSRFSSTQRQSRQAASQPREASQGGGDRRSGQQRKQFPRKADCGGAQWLRRSYRGVMGQCRKVPYASFAYGVLPGKLEGQSARRSPSVLACEKSAPAPVVNLL